MCPQKNQLRRVQIYSSEKKKLLHRWMVHVPSKFQISIAKIQHLVQNFQNLYVQIYVVHCSCWVIASQLDFLIK